MRTKNEIFDLLMGYLDMGIAMGFYTKEETKEIENLEKEYWIQSEEIRKWQLILLIVSFAERNTK